MEADDNEEHDDREDDTASDSSHSDIEDDVEGQEDSDTSQSRAVVLLMIEAMRCVIQDA